MNKVYGYCRISRKTQNIERQERNIRNAFPEAVIVREAYTGTKVTGRKEFEKILSGVKSGDTIVFDSVSRMSRNAEEGTKLYFSLYEKGINLVFMKEHHIDTDSYKKALAAVGMDVETDGTAAGDLVSDIMSAVTKFMRAKAADDIQKAFDQAQKEVDDLHERTKEGIETARVNGKQIGQKEGKKLKIKKEEPVKNLIRKYSRDFNGSNSDTETIALINAREYHICRNTYYKYKSEMEKH